MKIERRGERPRMRRDSNPRPQRFLLRRHALYRYTTITVGQFDGNDKMAQITIIQNGKMLIFVRLIGSVLPSWKPTFLMASCMLEVGCFTLVYSQVKLSPEDWHYNESLSWLKMDLHELSFANIRTCRRTWGVKSIMWRLWIKKLLLAYKSQTFSWILKHKKVQS